MKRAILLISIILFCPLQLQAAFDNYGNSARSMGLGNASIAMTDEPASVLSNPGALGFLQRKGLQASLSRLYDLDELSEKEFYFALPLGSVSLGGGLYVFGKPDYYQEIVFALAFAYRLGNSISIGSNLKYMLSSFSPEYDDLSTVSVDLGSVYRINNKVKLGFAVRNLNQPEMVNGSDDIPTNFLLGLAVFPFDEATLLLDISYEQRYKEQLYLGQEIKLLENLPLRFGIQTSPARYAFGFGLKREKFIMDYAYSNHSVLGDTHKISFSYLWGRKNSK
jgi:long-subunit fatty acid transport protein